jgi:hypothetical protein
MAARWQGWSSFSGLYSDANTKMGRRNTGNRLHHDRKAELMQTFQTLCKKYLNIQFLPQREHRPFLIGYLLKKIIAGCYKTDKKHININCKMKVLRV